MRGRTGTQEGRMEGEREAVIESWKEGGRGEKILKGREKGSAREEGREKGRKEEEN